MMHVSWTTLREQIFVKLRRPYRSEANMNEVGHASNISYIYLSNHLPRYRPIIENKSSDGSSLKQRKDAWQKVSDEFNATSVSAPRGAEQLKILWSNLRRTAKKNSGRRKCKYVVLKVWPNNFYMYCRKENIWIKMKMRMWQL
jgi:hypothetical protein